MSIFDDLNAEFKAWRDNYFDDQRASVRFTVQFAKGLQNYILAPESFRSIGTTQKPYIKTAKLVDKGDGEYEAVEPDNIFDTIQRGQGGDWNFAVQVALEIASNAYPKQYFGIPIHFIIDNGFAKLKITNRPDGELTYDLNDDTKNTAAYNFVAKLLQEIFRTKPSDMAQQKSPMGFIVPSSS